MYQQPKVCKIVLVGDHGVGKRSLLTTAFNVSERLSPFYIPIECTQVEGKARDTQVKLHFYDSLIRTSMVAKEDNIFVKEFCAEVIPNAQAVLMCFASDNVESLVNLREWSKTIKGFLKSNTFVYLVATKCDIRAHIDSDVYEEIKREIGSIHGRFSTSSITGENIEGLFAHIMKNFVRLPFTHNECVLNEEMASIQQGIATPRKSITPLGTPSFVMVTPEKRVVYHESTTFEEVVISRGYADMKTRSPQEVRGARALDATTDRSYSGFHRHTRSSPSFAWKQERKTVVDDCNKLIPKYVDPDLTQPEEEAEAKMDYLRPSKLLSDDLIRFASPYSERRSSGEEMRDSCLEIKISYAKEEVSSEKRHRKSESVAQVNMNRVEDESESGSPKRYIKIWF